MKKTLLILGDSTSMTIGMEQKVYPFLFADQDNSGAELEIVNCSQPGFTSADAAFFYFRHRKSILDLKAVIIYLGNCDAAASEIPKGRFTPFKQFNFNCKEKLGIKPKRTALKNRLLYLEWNENFQASLERSELPDDYEYNIARVVRDCQKLKVPVILIHADANHHFPPGVGKGNFVFYRYLSLHEHMAHALKIPDVRFVDALKDQENGRFEEAKALYQQILLKKHPEINHPEYPLLVTHNYAVCAAEQGDFDEAKTLFLLLLKERAARKEIILFNLAKLAQKRGDEENYQFYLKQSYEADESLYRIRKPYQDALVRLKTRFPKTITLVDQNALVSENEFIDHCHPVHAAQLRLNEKIREILSLPVSQSWKMPTITNILYNIELGFGNTQEFFTYYKTYLADDELSIQKIRESLQAEFQKTGKDASVQAKINLLNKEYRYAFEYYLKHPLFTSVSDVLHFGPVHPGDAGRFPEFFLMRQVIPYIRFLENSTMEDSFWFPESLVLRHSWELARALPEPMRQNITVELPPLENDVKAHLLTAIILKVKKSLLSHLEKKNQIYERIKTTMFWYFRETLRFGAHSRVSMRYERVLLEYCAEALAVARVFDDQLKMGRGNDIRKLFSFLKELVDTHELYCSQFIASTENKALLENYDSALERLETRLTAEESVRESENVCLF